MTILEPKLLTTRSSFYLMLSSETDKNSQVVYQTQQVLQKKLFGAMLNLESDEMTLVQ